MVEGRIETGSAASGSDGDPKQHPIRKPAREEIEATRQEPGDAGEVFPRQDRSEGPRTHKLGEPNGLSRRKQGPTSSVRPTCSGRRRPSRRRAPYLPPTTEPSQKRSRNPVPLAAIRAVALGLGGRAAVKALYLDLKTVGGLGGAMIDERALRSSLPLRDAHRGFERIRDSLYASSRQSRLRASAALRRRRYASRIRIS